jgi:uncharacterized protein
MSQGSIACKIFKVCREGFSGVSKQPPLIQLIIAFIIILVEGTLLFYILIFAGSLIFGTDIEKMIIIPAENPETVEIIILKYVQVSQQVALFLAPSVTLACIFREGGNSFLKINRVPDFSAILLVALMSVILIPVTTYAGILNTRMELPDFMTRIEEWMKAKEGNASDLTSLLINSRDGINLAVNLVIMALIPALSEEFLFRGGLQQLFSRFLRSAHAGIWTTAILFSTVHLQFYGFVPRLILGLIFGYLFYWTANLWLSVAAHFVNNASLIIFAFAEARETTETYINDSRNLDARFPVLPVIFCLLILYFFWYQFRRVRSSH